MGEQRPRHPQEPAEGSVEDVEASGAERADSDEEATKNAAEERSRLGQRPREPAEGGVEDVEASGAERAGEDDR